MKIMNLYVLAFFSSLIFVSCSNDDDVGPTLLPKQTLGEDDQTLTRYSVSGNVITYVNDHEVDANIISFRDNKALHDRIWGRFIGMVPTARRNFVKQFTPFHGGNEISGYVYPLASNRQDWSIGFDVLTAEVEFSSLDNPGISPANKNPALAFTAAHEYGHLLTLHGNELDLNVSEANCTTYNTLYGCLKTTALLDDYFNAHWEGQPYTDYLQFLNTQGEDGVAAAMFTQYPNSFVSEYAATSPEEDIAESFAVFIFQLSQPGINVKEEKINFFYNYPELVTLRDSMRTYLIKVVNGEVPLTGNNNFTFSTDFGNLERKCALH